MAYWSSTKNPNRPKGPGREFVSPREKILADWRGTAWADRNRERPSTAKAASDILPRILQSLNLDKRRCEAEVFKVWNHLIDPNVVAHAQPTGLKRGTLFVAVDSHVWLDEIVRYRRREILQRLQHSFGRDLIARISFRVG